MTLLIRIALWLPAWFVLILAGATFYLGTEFITVAEAENRKMQAAAAKTPPEMTDFDPAVAVPTGEVAFRARVFDDATYYFYYGNDGPTADREYFYFIEEPGATATDRVFSGVLIFESSDIAEARAWWRSVLVDPDNNDDLAEIRGYADTTDALSGDATEALYWLGGSRGETFVYIRPFFEGRAAFYESRILPIEIIRYGLWLAVGLMVLWALIRQVLGGRLKAARAAGGGAKTAATVASTAAGVAGLAFEDEEDNEEEDESYGLLFSIGKVLFGVLFKRRSRRRVRQDTLPEEDALIAAAAQSKSPRLSDQVIYTPPRNIYDENGMLIEAVPASVRRASDGYLLSQGATAA